MARIDAFLKLGMQQGCSDLHLAVGVPPMLLGIQGDNTYANYAEANRAFFRQAVVPMASRLAEALTGFLAPHFADLRLAHDLDQVEALAADRDAAPLLDQLFVAGHHRGLDAAPDSRAVQVVSRRRFRDRAVAHHGRGGCRASA